MRWKLILSIILLPTFSIAQHHYCGFDFLEGKTPRPSKKEIEQYEVSDQEFHVIPVVVHVFHDNGPENLPDSLIKNQIQVLNEDFGNYGNATDGEPLSTDTKIRFCLAKKDPTGKPTNGIIRIETSNPDIVAENEMRIKSQSRWPTDRYLNIWVVRSITFTSIGPNLTVQGYAYLPPNEANTNKDGVVVEYRFFGRTNPFSSNFNQGRTCTHEVGHYLNLYHPWGKDDYSCLDDDEVRDTPPCIDPYVPGPGEPKCFKPFQCNTTRLTSNFMEYLEDECLTMYTPGQTSRMRQSIVDYRSKLVHYANVEQCGCKPLYDSVNAQPKLRVSTYPNPVESSLKLSLFSSEERNLNISIFTTEGKEVYRETVMNTNSRLIEIDLSNLPVGMYILKADYGTEDYITRKIIKTP